jgi:polyvinyl alcohol dehydrogenase (cytochrome)
VRITRKIAKIACLGLLLAAVAGPPALAARLPADKGSWPMFGHDLHHTGHASGERRIGPRTAAQLVPKWHVETPRPITASPTVVRGVVYVGGWDGVFRALRASDGATLWTFQTDPHTGSYPGITDSAAVANGIVYFGAGPHVYALNAATGEMVWKFTAADGASTDGIETLSSPVVYQGKVFVGTDADETGNPNLGFYALDASTGTELWRFNGGTCMSVWSSPVIDESLGYVYFSTGNCGEWVDTGGELYPFDEAIVALDVDTGGVVWTFQPHPVDPYDYCFGQPPNLFTATTGGASRNLVGAASKEGVYYALDRATGGLVWKRRIGDPAVQALPGSQDRGSIGGIIGGFSFDGSRLYGPSASFTGAQHFVALAPDTGRVVWQDPSAPPSFAGTTTADGVVLSGGFDGTVRIYRADDGRLLTALPNGRIIASQAAVVNGSVYVGSGIEGSNINGKGLGEPGGAIQAYTVLDVGG